MWIRIHNPAKNYGVATLILPLFIESWRCLFVLEVEKLIIKYSEIQNGHPSVVADGSHGEL
jgi:hypothetical protein